MNNWKKKLFGEIAENFDSKRIPLSKLKRVKGKFPYYGASGVVDYVEKYLFDGEFLLISEDGENLNSRKTPIAFIANGKFWVNNHAHIIKGKFGVSETKYLCYLFQNLDISGFITGAVQPKLSQNSLNSIIINLPPLLTQRRIADILSALDDKIENNRKTSERLEQIAQSIFKRWFVDFDFPDAQGRPYKSSGGKMIENELGLIPEGWKIGTVSDLAKNGEIITGKTPPANIKNRFGDYLQFVTIPDLHQGSYIDKTERKLSKEGALSQNRSIIPPQSIMVSCIATPGLVGIASESCLTNQQINSFIPKRYVFSYFVMKTEKKKIIDFASSGSATPNLNKTQFSKMNIVIPLEHIIKDFQIMFESTFEEILNFKKENQKLIQTRDTLLPKLMSGELEV
jgi:type I restriction enzyme S subunit